MATWNHGDKTAGSTVQFNGKSYITRKDTGQTVYDTVASPAADPGLAAEIESLKQQLAAVSTGSGSGYGSVQFAGPTNTTYFYRRILGSTSNTVREEFETDVLAMSDGSLPSAAILFINCVNLNDSTFATPDKASARVMYKSPASTTAEPGCYINSRAGSGSGGSGVHVITGTYTGDGKGEFATWETGVRSAGQHIKLNVEPHRITIKGRSSQTLGYTAVRSGGSNSGIYQSTWTTLNDPERGFIVGNSDGFTVTYHSQSRGGQNPQKNGWTYSNSYGPNASGVIYDYTVEYFAGQSTQNAVGGTYGPGTQAIVPVHPNGKAKLIAHINKLAAGQVPDDCFLEMWVVGVMGGGGSVPDNNYANLLARIEALEAGTPAVSGVVPLGSVGYTFTATATKSTRGVTARSCWAGQTKGHTLSNFKAVSDEVPDPTADMYDFSLTATNDSAIPGTITNDSGVYQLLYSPPTGATAGKRGRQWCTPYSLNTAQGTAIRIE